MAKEPAKSGASPSERTIPPIKASNVHADPSQYFRRIEVRVPAGVTVQDLHDYPEKLWSAVQDHPNTALRRFDEVRVIAHDESWMIADAIVTDADTKRVVLDFKRIVQLGGRHETFEDDKFRIFFDGPDGFVVERKADHVRMLKGFATVEQAKSEMFKNLYPRAA